MHSNINQQFSFKLGMIVDTFELQMVLDYVTLTFIEVNWDARK